MKNWVKLVIAIASALATIAAVVLVVLKYREQVMEFAKKAVAKMRSYCPGCSDGDELVEDFDDFADVED